MARETQKEKIERLEKELDTANSIIQKLNNEISKMIDKADNSFENSSTYKQMSKQIETLTLKVKAISDSSEHNRKMYNAELKRNSDLIKEIQQLKNENQQLRNADIYKLNNEKKHNERGAGRKQQILDDERQKIRDYRAEGHTIKEISKIFNRSVGIIHKIINEK